MNNDYKLHQDTQADANACSAQGSDMPQLTREQAIALSETKFWEAMTPREIAEFQLHTECLCMPFDVFHEAMEKALGRPIFTHEFGLNPDGLKKELRGEAGPPTFEEIVNLIPAEKRIVVTL